MKTTNTIAAIINAAQGDSEPADITLDELAAVYGGSGQSGYRPSGAGTPKPDSSAQQGDNQHQSTSLLEPYSPPLEIPSQHSEPLSNLPQIESAGGWGGGDWY